MTRRIIMLSLAILVVAGIAAAGDKPWFDMDCSMCKNLYGVEGLMENMSWEQLDISNGVLSVTLVEEDYLPAYRKAHMGMQETGMKLQKGEMLPVCGSCTAFGACMTKGVNQEYVETMHGDVWIVTSDNDEVVAELKAWAKRNREEMAKMKPEKG
jgi:hypothetical protein